MFYSELIFYAPIIRQSQSIIKLTDPLSLFNHSGGNTQGRRQKNFQERELTEKQTEK